MNAPDWTLKMHRLKKSRHFEELHDILLYEPITYDISLNSQKIAFSADSDFKCKHTTFDNSCFCTVICFAKTYRRTLSRFNMSKQKRMITKLSQNKHNSITSLKTNCLCKDKHNNITKHNIFKTNNSCCYIFLFSLFGTACGSFDAFFLACCTYKQ